jgi:arsenate reductase
MSSVSIYHNPRCSKSRETLALLNDKGIKPEIIEYLKTPPSISELTHILSQLAITPRQLLRKNESIYKELNLKNTELTDEFLIHTMCENPKLIERPIVINNNSARLGRPPESVLDII